MEMVPVGCRAKNSARPSRSWFVFIDMVVLALCCARARAITCHFLSISIPFLTHTFFLFLFHFSPLIHSLSSRTSSHPLVLHIEQLHIISISIPFHTSHTFLVLQDFQPPIHIADADFVNLTANRSKCDETGCLGT